MQKVTSVRRSRSILRQAAALSPLERRVLLDASVFDDTFGDDGLLAFSLNVPIIGFGPDTATVTSFEPVAAAADAAGNTYVLGDVGIRARLSNTFFDYTDAGVIKLLPNGQRDTTFGTDAGVATIQDPLGLDVFSFPLPNRTAGALVLDADGRVVFTGTAFDTSPNGEGDVMVGRLTTAGDPDPTFFPSDGGFGGTFIDLSDFNGFGNNSEDDARAIAIDPLDQTIVVGGGTQAFTGGQSDVFLLKLDANGTLDTTFGDRGNGILTTEFPGSDDIINALTIDPFDGRIIAAGSTTSGSVSQFAVLAYSFDGILDTGFGGFSSAAGTMVFSFATPGDSLDEAYAVDVDPLTGEIYVGGYTATFDLFTLDFNSNLAVAKLNSNGSFDSDWAFEGQTIITLPVPISGINKLSVLPDGGLLMAGDFASGFDNTTFDFTTTGVFLGLLDPGGFLDTTLSDDGIALFDDTLQPFTPTGSISAAPSGLVPANTGAFDTLEITPTTGNDFGSQLDAKANGIPVEKVAAIGGRIFFDLVSGSGSTVTTARISGAALGLVPTVSLPTAITTVTTGSFVQFVLRFQDDVAVIRNSIAATAVQIIQPNSAAAAVTVVAVSSATDAKTIDVTFQFTKGANFTVADNGTYSIQMLPSVVLDGNQQSVAAGIVGTFTINIAPTQTDVVAPTATATIPAAATAAVAAHQFTVTFSDNTAIAVASIGTGDVQVTGPGGFSQPATFLGLDANTNGTPRTATFSIAAPGGTFDNADNGTYTVTLLAATVSDTTGNVAPQTTLGTFTVNVPAAPVDTTAPTATASIAPSAVGGAAFHPITVTFADNTAIAIASIGTGDILVTGPNGFSQPATFLSLDSEVVGTPRTASFQIAAPGGTWDVNDNGTYTVTLLAGTVADTAGNVAGQTTLGNFAVDAPQGPGVDLRADIASAYRLTSFVAGAKGADTSVRVFNSGDAALARATFSIRILFSTDAIVDGGDFVVGTLSARNVSLRPGASRVFKVSKLLFPNVTAPSTLRVLAVVDADNALAEANESNNLAAATQTINVAPPFTDLRGTIGKLAAKFRLGKKASIPLSLFNDGNVAAKGTVNVRLIASTDDVLDQNDRTLAVVPVKLNVNANKSGRATASVTIPADLAAGAYRIIAVVNTDAALGESNLANNTLFSTVAVNVAVK
jgi:uncharacterized delta-60 repeat protein